jgi:hypothetical protein
VHPEMSQQIAVQRIAELHQQAARQRLIASTWLMSRPPRWYSSTDEQRRLHAVGLRERLADRVEQCRSVRLGPQRTAFFTSAPILASSVAVNSVSAKEVGHMLPSSRFAVALKPNVAYLSLNFDAGVK